MSQASLFQYYSVCKRKVDESFKKDKEQQPPLPTNLVSPASSVDLQLPRSKLLDQNQPLSSSSSTSVSTSITVTNSETTATTSSSSLSFSSTSSATSLVITPSSSFTNLTTSLSQTSSAIKRDNISQSDSSAVESTSTNQLPFVGKDENTSTNGELQEVSPFKVPTTPVPRRIHSVNRKQILSSKSKSTRSRSGTPDPKQQSILKWAKRRPSNPIMAAGSVSPLRMSDQLKDSKQSISASTSASKSTFNTPKRKKHESDEEDEVDACLTRLNRSCVDSPSSSQSPRASPSRKSIRCSLIEPMRAVQSCKLDSSPGKDADAPVVDTKQCSEALEKARAAQVAKEKFEMLGSGSNLAALRQRMKNSEQTSGNQTQDNVTNVMVSPSKDRLVLERKLAFGKCSNLAELREKLAGQDRSFLEKIKQFERSISSPAKLNVAALNPTSPTKKMADIGSPASRRNLVLNLTQSPKKLLEEIYSNSPIKSRPDSRTSISSDGLNLPLKYKQLIDSFYCLDSVVSMIYNRQEMCTFDKVRAGVQKITKKNFETRLLAQMMSIYPSSYECKWDKAPASDQHVLVLKPCVPSVKISPSILKIRKNQFEEKLLNFAKIEHQKYLSSLIPPIEVSPELLRKWHPSFKFPDIPEAKLPEAPVKSISSGSVSEFWNKTVALTTKAEVEKPLEQTKKESNKELITKGPLRGLSMGFLEKIKNKEAALLAKEMTRKPEDDRKLTMIAQLPLLMRTLHSYFVSEKKASIRIESVIQECLLNSLSLSVGTCNDYINLMNELLPDWLFILKVGKGTFIKIDKNKVLDDLFARLDRIALRLKQN